MSFVAVFMCMFSMLGAIDRIFGNRFGLGKEFERGVTFLGLMALTMIGIIVISPAIADLLAPVLDFVYDKLGVEPSIIPAILFANDMGGAPLAVEVAKDAELGMFNALVVSSMMGATISFTLPFSLGIVKAEQHRNMFLGLLCGIVTVPMGCVVSGLMLSIGLKALLVDLLPLIVFSVIVAVGILLKPMLCVRIFDLLGKGLKILITLGLALGILRFLTGVELISGLATLEEGAAVCLNASAVMTGAFPFMYLLSRVLSRPVQKLAGVLQINEASAFGLVSTMATNATTFEKMGEMDGRGVVINSAFAVSAAFTFASHLAFTMAKDASYIPAVVVGKLVAGVTAVLVALLVSKKKHSEKRPA